MTGRYGKGPHFDQERQRLMTNRNEHIAPAPPLTPPGNHVLVRLQNFLADAMRHRADAKAVLDQVEDDVRDIEALIAVEQQRIESRNHPTNGQQFGAASLAPGQGQPYEPGTTRVDAGAAPDGEGAES